MEQNLSVAGESLNVVATTNIPSVEEEIEENDQEQVSAEKLEYYRSFQGRDDSSDEEIENNDEDDNISLNDDEKIELQANEYSVLNDDFGEFISCEVEHDNFADFNSSHAVSDFSECNGATLNAEDADLFTNVENIPQPPPAVAINTNCIPPFTQGKNTQLGILLLCTFVGIYHRVTLLPCIVDKVDQIKNIMSKITIKMPNSGAGSNYWCLNYHYN